MRSHGEKKTRFWRRVGMAAGRRPGTGSSLWDEDAALDIGSTAS
jgi:hypothetical protein